ncbi:MAG: nuclear transport factor 2 family protein, partial [Acidobacteria bacterium]|nr:nuclear transport factor 2 family protein [Acidobacteriota bacterium]MCA1639884.1 nuclear transport factor 2 family protein [Acidobacteriota bacterium]
DEQEILKIHSSLEQAFLKKDAAVFERIFADDYVYSNPYGKMFNRAEGLEDLRKEWTNTNYKILTSTSDDLKVKVSGNMALVTGNWTSTTVPPDDANAEPHKDTGRYTGVYEKRNGKWLLIAEHYSEAQHDRKLMEQQVLKMGKEYGEMIRRGDAAAIERILADDYFYTDEKGKVKNKAEDLATYKNREYKIESVEQSDQKVRVIGNNAAIETANFRVKGTGKDGKAFDDTYRYTTTWVWRGGRWQVAADHTSMIKKS